MIKPINSAMSFPRTEKSADGCLLHFPFPWGAIKPERLNVAHGAYKETQETEEEGTVHGESSARVHAASCRR